MAQTNPYEAPAPEPPAVSITQDRERLKRVARAQRHVMFSILLYCGLLPLSIGLTSAGPGTPAVETMIPIIFLIVFALCLVSIYRLASLVRGPRIAVIHALGLLVPLLGLLLLLSNNAKATKELQLAGIKVGLLGANSDSI